MEAQKAALPPLIIPNQKNKRPNFAHNWFNAPTCNIDIFHSPNWTKLQLQETRHQHLDNFPTRSEYE